mmetsp:Transcript_12729/g.44595  ORF Transcript_12729/g.44595 Transcript_12729/m.44595 type:complete len:86 (-) Transcript_12729:2647-2904(-)
MLAMHGERVREMLIIVMRGETVREDPENKRKLPKETRRKKKRRRMRYRLANVTELVPVRRIVDNAMTYGSAPSGMMDLRVLLSAP